MCLALTVFISLLFICAYNFFNSNLFLNHFIAVSLKMSLRETNLQYFSHFVADIRPLLRAISFKAAALTRSSDFLLSKV